MDVLYETKRAKRQRVALQVLDNAHALLRDGHFVLKSWRHATEFAAKDQMLLSPRQTKCMAEMVAELILDEFGSQAVEVIASAATAGAIFGHQVAQVLSDMLSRDILSVFVDKDGDEFVLGRDYDKTVKGKRVLFIEDILTTGKTTAGAVSTIEKAGGIVLGAVAIWNRGKVTPEMAGVTALLSLIELELGSMTKEECLDHGPCSQSIPIRTDHGHGAQYLKNLEPS